MLEIIVISIPKNISIAFNNGFQYDCDLVKKDLAEEFKKQLTCLGEKTKKYITFTIPIEKKLQELIIMEKQLQNISHILQFLDSARFSASLLSNLVNNPSEGTHKIKCEYRHDDKKCETCRIKYKYCDCFL